MIPKSTLGLRSRRSRHHTRRWWTITNTQLPRIVQQEHIENLEKDRRAWALTSVPPTRTPIARASTRRRLMDCAGAATGNQTPLSGLEMGRRINAYRAELGMAVELVEAGCPERSSTCDRWSSESEHSGAFSCPRGVPRTDSRLSRPPCSVWGQRPTIPDFLKRE